MGIINWFKKLLQYDPSVYRAERSNQTRTSKSSSMNEGDFHSGPTGYSANTAYPDTFYGSGGSDSSEMDQNEGDFNR